MHYFALFFLISFSCMASSSFEETIRKDMGLKKILTIETIKPLLGGRSGAAVFLVNDAYVVKRTDKTKPYVNEFQSLAAEKGVAPKLYYRNSLNGIVAMEFVKQHDTPEGFDAAKMSAELLQGIHSIQITDDMPTVDQWGVAKELMKVAHDEKLPATLIERLEAALAQGPSLELQAVCHNDLNPTNIIFDSKRLIAIDWDEAKVGDPYYDLGKIAIWHPHDPTFDARFLEAYLGSKPSDKQVQHYSFMKKVATIISGLNLLQAARQFGYEGGYIKPDQDLVSFLRGLGEGKIDFARPENMHKLGTTLLGTI